MSNSDQYLCPLEPVEKRLLDCLILLGEVRKNYCSHDLFRINLNSSIQSLRNVTFILQKQKKKLKGFDKWYENQRDLMKKNKVMKWIHSSRNQIVKEGDLATFSKAEASFVESWLANPIYSMNVPLFIDDTSILDLVSKEVDVSRINTKLLRIERMWVDDNFKEMELLDALSEAFIFLFNMLLDGHIKCVSEAKSSQCSFYALRDEFKLVILKLKAQREDRITWMNLQTRKKYDFIKESMVFSEECKEEAIARYGEDMKKENFFKIGHDPKSFKDQVDFYFEQAKFFVKKDGTHANLAFLLFPDNTINMYSLNAEDRAEKHVIYNNLAVDVEKTGASGIILICEAWRSNIDILSKGIQHASDDPDHKEILMVVGLNSAGESRVCTVVFHKNGDGAILGKDEFSDASSLNFMEPLRKVWNL